jgi:hypothetical protein
MRVGLALRCRSVRSSLPVSRSLPVGRSTVAVMVIVVGLLNDHGRRWCRSRSLLAAPKDEHRYAGK